MTNQALWLAVSASVFISLLSLVGLAVFFVKAEKYLYYKFKHSEKISDLIKKIEAKVVGDHYVRVKLILLTNDSLSFLVKVRNGLKI